MEKTLNKDVIFKGKILELEVHDVELIDGTKTKREIIRHAGGVVIIGYTKEGKIPFVSQYRKPFDEMVLELPAGKLEANEDPEICARREFQEETGYLAKNITYLGQAKTSPGYSDETIYIYKATDLTYSPVEIDEDEFLNLTEYDKEEVRQLIKNDQLRDAKSLAAVCLELLK
ncbi:MAG: NUDIX hydrolase [Clostridiaceae bacterium]